MHDEWQPSLRFAIPFFLKKHKKLTIRELCRKTGKTRQSIQGTCIELVEQGTIKRKKVGTRYIYNV